MLTVNPNFVRSNTIVLISLAVNKKGVINILRTPGTVSANTIYAVAIVLFMPSQLIPFITFCGSSVSVKVSDCESPKSMESFEKH